MKTFWIIVGGSYDGDCHYEVTASSVEEVQELVRLNHDPLFPKLRAVFDTPPLLGDFVKHSFRVKTIAGRS